MKNLTRITFDPNVMGGKHCIRGLRVTVGAVVGLVATGYSTADILKACPYLEEEDIREALAYAAWRAEENGSAAGCRMKLLIDMNFCPRESEQWPIQQLPT